MPAVLPSETTAASETAPGPRKRLALVGLGLVVVSVVASPAFRDPREDAYPLSTYPMFARDRGRTATVTSAWATGRSVPPQAIPPIYVANAEPMQALQVLKKTARSGRKQSRRLCRAIATRLDQAHAPRFAAYEHVEIATQRVDPIAFFQGRAVPERVRLHARCRVSRSR